MVATCVVNGDRSNMRGMYKAPESKWSKKELAVVGRVGSS